MCGGCQCVSGGVAVARASAKDGRRTRDARPRTKDQDSQRQSSFCGQALQRRTRQTSFPPLRYCVISAHPSFLRFRGVAPACGRCRPLAVWRTTRSRVGMICFPCFCSTASDHLLHSTPHNTRAQTATSPNIQRQHGRPQGRPRKGAGEAGMTGEGKK